MQAILADEKKRNLVYLDFCATLYGSQKDNGKHPDRNARNTIIACFDPSNEAVLRATGRSQPARTTHVFEDISVLIVTVASRVKNSTAADAAALVVEYARDFEVVPFSVTPDGAHTFHRMQVIGFALFRKNVQTNPEQDDALLQFCVDHHIDCFPGPVVLKSGPLAPPASEISSVPHPTQTTTRKSPSSKSPKRSSATKKTKTRNLSPHLEPHLTEYLTEYHQAIDDKRIVSHATFVRKYSVNQGNWSRSQNHGEGGPAVRAALEAWVADGCCDILCG